MVKKATNILILIAFLCHISSWAMEEEIQPVSIPDIITKKSTAADMLKRRALDPEKIKLSPGVTQEMVNDLANLYQNTAVPLEKKEINHLLDIVNLEEFLQPDEYSALLQKNFIDVLKTTKLTELQDHLLNLNPRRAAVFMATIVKNEKIDSALLKPYSDFLTSHPKIIPNNIKNSGYFNAEDLLFFNKDIQIYGVIWGMNPGDEYDTILIKNNYDNSIKEIHFTNFIDPNINVNKNSTYCIFYDKRLHNPNNYQLWSLNPVQSHDLSALLNQTITAYCFADNNTICTANTQGEIALLNLNDFKSIKTITTFSLQQNEFITRIEYRQQTDNTKPTIVALTNLPNLHILNNGAIHVKPSSEWLINEDAGSINFNGTSVSLNNSGSNLYIAAKLKYYPIFASQYFTSILNLSSLQEKHILTADSITHVEKLYWTQNDSILTIQYHYWNLKFSGSRSSQKKRKKYSAINPNTSNNWDLSIIPDAIIADDGNSCIVTESGMLTTTTKQITLCDDIITGTLDYLNPDKAHQKTPQQRLLGTILLYHIVKRLKKPVTLDVTETQIYNDCLSSEIQTLLKTIDFVIPATQQQSRLSIFRNYTSSAYNSLSKKLSEYKLGLMFGSVASAVAIVAAYRYLTSK